MSDLAIENVIYYVAKICQGKKRKNRAEDVCVLLLLLAVAVIFFPYQVSIEHVGHKFLEGDTI